MNTCKACGETKGDDEFYISDNGRCKECIKSRVRSNRAKNADYYRAYDAMRFKRDPWRLEGNLKRQATPEYREEKKKTTRKWLDNNPEKRSAHLMVQNAVNRGEIIKPSSCSICGRNDCRIHGHHTDYSKPLEVMWLCPKCHMDQHRKEHDFEALGIKVND